MTTLPLILPHKTGPLFLGVDGGASKVTVAVVDATGTVIYERTDVGGANYHAIGLATAVEHLETLLHESVRDLGKGEAVVFDRAVFGLAGCNFDSDTEILTEALRRSSVSTLLGKGCTVVNDSHIALRSGTEDDCGLVLIAGTGSNCYGKTASGQTAQAGGLDHILSDEGSGYDVGLRGLRAVVRSLDGRGQETSLTQRFFKELAVTDLASLYEVVYKQYADKPHIASLAKGVLLEAEEGDVVALDIVNHTVNALVSLVDAVISRLDLQHQPIMIIQVGSLLEQPLLLNRLQQELKRVASQATITSPKASSAVGAAWLAWDQSRAST